MEEQMQEGQGSVHPAAPCSSDALRAVPLSEPSATHDHARPVGPLDADSLALEAAQEIALMWGQDRTQFVAKIQVRVRAAIEAAQLDAYAEGRKDQVEADQQSTAASALIDAWVAQHGRPISWEKAVEITAILTKMPDAERARLLSLSEPQP